jgi:beta-lactamase regulating signal transducer with metallopeptidase domain/Tol biopolymer transport system component
MDQFIDSFLVSLNSVGRYFWDYAANMFLQSSVLIVLLLIIDLILRRRTRAALRYCLWMLIFIKLLLPPTLSLPTGIGYWYGDYVSSDSPVLKQLSTAIQQVPIGSVTTEEPIDASTGLQAERSLPSPGVVDQAALGATSVTKLTWQTVAFLVWVSGVLVLLCFIVQRVLFVRRLVIRSEPVEDQSINLHNKCRQQLGINQDIRLRSSDHTPGPAVCGLFRPTILMPPSLLQELPPDRLRAVLIHELAHIKRKDLWINSLQTLIQIIYFYNPFVWIANKVVRKIREQAVDEMVLVTLGTGAKSYSKTLIYIAHMAFWKTSLTLRLIGVAESKKALKWRIRHMLTRPMPKSASVGMLGTIIIIVVAAVCLPMAKAKKSEDTESPSTRQVVTDPNTGLQFHKIESITGEKDTAYYSGMLSPDRRFWLYDSKVIPLQGGTPFNLVDFPLRQWWWSPDSKKVALVGMGDNSIWLVRVSPKTGRPSGQIEKLIDANESLGREVTWSPDSNAFTYLSVERHLWRFSLQDHSRRLITEERITRNSWSPDGKWIVCNWYEEQNEPWVCLVPSTGGKLRKLCKVEGINESHWSPDSKWVFYENKKTLYFIRISDARQIEMLLPEEVGNYLSWSPEDNKMLFYRSSYEWEISLKILPASGDTLLKPLKDLQYSGTYDEYWSQDGRFVATSDYERFWIIPLAGGKPFPLELNVDVEGKLWQESLSPDCTKVLFGSNVDGREERWVVPISMEHGKTTGEPIKVFGRLEEGRFRWAKWSPDGSKLALIYQDDVWIANIDGSPPVQLTETPELEFIVDWISNGKAITWSSQRPSTRESFFYICAVTEGEPVKLVDVPGAYGYQVSKDGTKAIYMLVEGEKKALWTITIPQKEPKKLMEFERNPRRDFACALSPDSRQLAVLLGGKVSIYSLPEGERRQIADFSDLDWSRYPRIVWSPDGQTIALILNPKVRPPDWWTRSGARIFTVPASGGEWTEVATEDGGFKFSIEYSPDGKWIAYSSESNPRPRPEGTIWEVEIDSFLKKAAEESTSG